MNRRSGLIAVVLAAIVLGLSLVTLLTHTSTTQAYSVQRVVPSVTPAPSLSPTATPIATSTNGEANPWPRSDVINLISPLISALIAALVSWLIYKAGQSQAIKVRDDRRNLGYISNFSNKLNEDMKKIISPRIRDIGDFSVNWDNNYILLRATGGGFQVKNKDEESKRISHINKLIEGQNDINTIIQLEQKKLKPNIGVQENGRLAEFVSIFEKDRKKRWLLIGEPGAGKTIYLKKLVLNILDGKSKEFPQVVLPIYVECKELVRFSEQFNEQLRNSQENKLYELIAFMWQEKYQFPQRNGLAYIKEQVNAGKALFLLDGLDEAPLDEDSMQVPINYHKNIAKYIIDELKPTVKLPIPNKVPVIITVRGPLDPILAGYPGLGDFNHVTVENFTPEDIWSFVDKYRAERYQPQSDEDTRAKQLKTVLGNNPRLQAFTATPLSLLLLLVLFTQKFIQSLPYNRANIYKNYVDTVLETYKFHQCKLTSEQQQHVLGHLAWYLHTHNRYMCTGEKMLQVIGDSLNEMNCTIATRERAFMELRLKSGMIKQDIEEKTNYRFTSITLQEYFAAQYVITHPQEEGVLSNNQNHPWWEEVILLYIQCAGDRAISLLEALADVKGSWSTTPEHKFYTRLLLAGRSLVNTQVATVTRSQGGNDNATPGNNDNTASIATTTQSPPMTGADPQPATVTLPLPATSAEPQSATATLPPPTMPPQAQSGVIPQPLIEDTLYNKIKKCLYGLLLSAETPLFVQEQVTKILFEMGIANVPKDDLTQLTKLSFLRCVPIENGLDILVNDNGSVSLLLFCSLREPMVSEQERWQINKFARMIERPLGQARSIQDLLKNDNINVLIRMRITHTLIAQEKYYVADKQYKLYELLSDSNIEPEIRGCIANALGILGDQSLASDLFSLLKNNTIPLSTHWNIVTALGKIAGRTLGHSDNAGNSATPSIAAQLLGCLNGDDPTSFVKNPFLRWNIATTLIHTLYEDRRKVSQLIVSDPNFPEPIRHGIEALESDNNVDSINRLLNFLLPPTPPLLTPDLIEQYIWICQILEKLTINRDMEMNDQLKELKERWKSEAKLVESLSRLEWTIARGTKKRKSID